MFDIIKNHEQNVYVIIYLGHNNVSRVETHDTETEAIKRMSELECEFITGHAA